jgi:hypothetical protein
MRDDDIREIIAFVEPPCLHGGEAVSSPKVSPIDLVTKFTQLSLVELITHLDNVDSFEIFSLPKTSLTVQNWQLDHWQLNWSLRVQTEGTVRKLSAALSSEQWSKGHAPLANKSLQEYVIVLDRLRSYGEYIGEGVQQVNASMSVEETRRAMQQSDSIRR